MKRVIKTFLIILFLVLELICLSGCQENNDQDNLKSKVIQELDYLDIKIVEIINSLNDITLTNYTISKEEIQMGKKNLNSSYESSEGKQEESGSKQKEPDSNSLENSNLENNNVKVTSMEIKNNLDSDETNIDWEKIKNEIETINDTWGIIVLDLTSINVNNDDILEFSEGLNNAIISIKEENKNNSLINLAKLYSLIPKFFQQVNQNSSLQNIKQAKSDLINAYSFVEQDDWIEVQNNLKLLDTSFKNVVNDIEFIKNKEFKVNRTYVLIKELENCLTYKDKKLFLVKYINLMDSINTL